MLKVLLIKTGLRLVVKFGQKLLDDGKISKDEAREVLTDEMTKAMKILPNVVTDEVRRREQSRRSKEGDK